MPKVCAVLLSFILTFFLISPRDGPPSFIDSYNISWTRLAFLGGPNKLSFADGKIEPRKVKVVALIDKDVFVSNPNAAQEIIDAMDFVSAVFKKEFNVVFEVTRFEPWEFPSTKTEVSLQEALNDVALIANGQPKLDDEIFLGFSSKFLFLLVCDSVGDKTVCIKEEKTGYAYVFGNAAVIKFNDRSKYIALHEAGHLFGATHTEENSVMNKQIKNSTEFDEKNKEIIMKNRELFFPRIYVP